METFWKPQKSENIYVSKYGKMKTVYIRLL